MSNKTATITIRIEPELKKEAEDILHNLGISTSTLITMLYKQIVSRKKIPFEAMLLSDNFYDGNVEEMIKDSKNKKTYSEKYVKNELLNYKSGY